MDTAPDLSSATAQAARGNEVDSDTPHSAACKALFDRWLERDDLRPTGLAQLALDAALPHVGPNDVPHVVAEVLAEADQVLRDHGFSHDHAARVQLRHLAERHARNQQQSTTAARSDEPPYYCGGTSDGGCRHEPHVTASGRRCPGDPAEVDQQTRVVLGAIFGPRNTGAR